MKNRPSQDSSPLSTDSQDQAAAVFAGLPVKDYAHLQSAIAQKQYGIGVDPLAAAHWSSIANGGLHKLVITTLSILLVLAAFASGVVAIAVQNYWLLLALPIQGLAFYGAHLEAPYRMWVTIAGVLSIIIFLNLLLNDLPTAATLVAYAGLTFSAVRATTAITNSAFRKALLADEQLFSEAYANRACTIRNTKTKRVYQWEDE